MSSNCEEKFTPTQWGRGDRNCILGQPQSWRTAGFKPWVLPASDLTVETCVRHWAGTKQVVRCSYCLRPFPFWARAFHSTCSCLLQSSQNPAPHLSPAVSLDSSYCLNKPAGGNAVLGPRGCPWVLVLPQLPGTRLREQPTACLEGLLSLSAPSPPPTLLSHPLPGQDNSPLVMDDRSLTIEGTAPRGGS